MLARSTLRGGTLAVDAPRARETRRGMWRVTHTARRAPPSRAVAARSVVPRPSMFVVDRRAHPMARSSRPASVATRAAGDDRTAASRARLDAIREEDEGDVEDPGERGSVDMFSGLNLTPETLAYWESQNAFFFPRLLLVGMTALGLAASIPQSLGGLFRGDDDALSVLATNVVFFLLSAGFTAVDLKRRRSALSRLQRELALGDMQVIQRDKFRNERVFPLASLRQAARVAIVYGDAEKVARDLAAATPYRRRLEQSRILVVPVVQRSRDGVGEPPASAVADVGPGRWELLKDVVLAWPGAGAGRWLAWPTRNDAWAGYFRRLLASVGAAADAGGYVTLGVNGQVRGSGVGAPSWDVLLSTFPRNRPGNAQDDAAERAWREATVDGAVGELGAVDTRSGGAEKLRDIRGEGAARPIGTTLELPAEGPAAEVLAVHNAFYDALGKGDEEGMRATWRPATRVVAEGIRAPSKVAGFVAKGARLDGWETVLRPDRRPEGLRLSDVDVTVERDQATVTVLETVANGATLLATQSFERVDEEWVLRSHYTIPYGKDTVAKIALRCDERGCVAVPAKAIASE
jgi:hypothetical protein